MAAIFDGVLADFNSSFIDLVVRLTGKDLFPPRPFEIPCWSYPEYYGYTAEDNSKVWEWIEDSQFFWQNLLVYNDTCEMLAQLYGRHLQGDYIYFATSRPGIFAKQQTELWLQKWAGKAGLIPTVLITADKAGIAEALKLTHYIDDKLDNVYEVASITLGGPITYLMNQPWNQGELDYPSIRRISSPLDMLKDL